MSIMSYLIGSELWLPRWKAVALFPKTLVTEALLGAPSGSLAAVGYGRGGHYAEISKNQMSYIELATH